MMFRVGLACLLGAIVAASCDSGEEAPTVLSIGDAVAAFDDAYCDRLVECDCDEEFQPSPSECRAQIEQEIEELRQAGEGNGLVYDGAFLRATLDRLDDRGCSADDVDVDVDDANECELPCHAYHGTGKVGDECTQFSYFSDCAQGLTCAFEYCEDVDCPGTCRNPCARAEIGESCDTLQCVEGAECDWETNRCVADAGPGDPCSDRGCAEGLICDFENDRCVRLPEVGDACFQGSCAEDLFCVTDPVDPTVQICNAPGELDAACMGHRQCESGYCPAGFCRELPGKGDECFGTCDDGLECDFESSKCIEAPAAVCNDNPL